MRWLVVIILFSSLLATPVSALRCSSDLVQEGDTKFEVIERCGEPLSIEFVGYRLDGFGNRDLVIEHLIYGPWKGWYYLIELVGGKVTKIESFR
ncbi:MAG: DUF2845 domain-containing protein [Deltaproteobacteria bacterium]|nr:DUF2845 domain-containing protein [Deltaproteobacteria bacterium]MBW2503592.1 DUF2845 domain-containing protein [Deltaproteobacteria bacterium]MBW2519802.1 DUF2845 domain-containing protein [Deltaproteobacteria bacterium]